MPKRIPGIVFVLALLLGVFAGPVVAGNVDLSTIPARDTVQLTIYNSRDITLVRETRRLTFRAGMNPLQFSWANTLIDPSSVELRFVTRDEALDVVDTTYPHDRPQVLVWNVRSGFDGDAVVEISYFTSGITWAADYVCTADPDETQMAFDGYVKITNNSGEDYPDASVRLVVGEINLVEQIAELARRGMIDPRLAEQFGRGGGGGKTYGEMDEEEQEAVRFAWQRSLAVAEGRTQTIVKDGLSEYFIFTVEGEETIPTGWSKRLRLFDGQDVPFDIEYRYRPAEYGDRLVRLFVLRNDTASALGTCPLPDGDVRLFRDNGSDGLSFLTSYRTKYVPIGQEIELNLGVDPEVVHERIRMRSWRDDFWFRHKSDRRLFSPTKGDRIEPRYTVVGWDQHNRWVERIRNQRDRAIDVEIRRSYDGHVVFISDLDPTLYDYRSPQFASTIAPRGTGRLAYTVTTRQGVNATQQSVTLRDGD